MECMKGYNEKEKHGRSWYTEGCLELTQKALCMWYLGAVVLATEYSLEMGAMPTTVAPTEKASLCVKILQM